MDNQLSALIQYYRACYQADQREANIWNIFDKKVEQLYFTEGQEILLNGLYPQQFIHTPEAEKILKTLKLYEKEKQLYYFSFFIVGKTSSEQIGRKSICAPVLYYPAELFTDIENNYFFRIDFSRQQVNYPLLALLDNIEDSQSEQAFFESIPQGIIDFPQSQMLENTLKPFLTEVDFSEAKFYPEQLYDPEALQALMQSDKLQWVPASTLGIMQISRTTRGVLNELESLSQAQSFSKPLLHLLGDSQSSATAKSPDNFQANVPALLSQAQENIIRRAQNQHISLVIGPPGTGKSYTIAALATDAMSRGKSVLIATNSEPALDVIHDKIIELVDAEHAMVQSGSAKQRIELKKYLESLLQSVGVYSTKPDVDAISMSVKQVERRIWQKQKAIKRYNRKIDKHLSRTQAYAEQAASSLPDDNFIKRWLLNYKRKGLRTKNQREHTLLTWFQAKEKLEQELRDDFKQYFKFKRQHSVSIGLTYKRWVLADFFRGLKARRDVDQEQYFANFSFKDLFDVFPVWLVSISELYHVLPLQKNLFDYVIIDEATQCDIASCLPLLQRAKQLVVVGDGQQLRHVSFLSRLRQQQLQRHYKLDQLDPSSLDYRNTSLLDLVRDKVEEQANVSFLDEHFRSRPDIIAFSNKHFYYDSLHLMQQGPHLKQALGLELVQLHGSRHESGYNKVEADWIIQKILAIYQQGNLPMPSVGIVSPFREQVEHLAKKIEKELPLELVEALNLMVGTAHAFQGNERDIMFISWVIDPKSHHGVAMHLNKSDVFNVSITRARSKQYVVCSVQAGDVRPGSYLHKYLSSMMPSSLPQQAEHKHELPPPAWMGMHEAFTAKGWTVTYQQTVASSQLDILLWHNGQWLGLLVQGMAQRNFRSAAQLSKTSQLLQRAGLPVMVITLSLWEDAREAVLAEISRRLTPNINGVQA